MKNVGVETLSADQKETLKPSEAFGELFTGLADNHRQHLVTCVFNFLLDRRGLLAVMEK